jgi:hypothetical protein
MSTLAVTTQITQGTLAYAPAVLAGVAAAESAAPLAPGASKQAAVVSAVLNGIEVGSGALESSPNPTIAGVALLVNLFVSIFSSLGIFKHAAPAAVVAAVKPVTVTGDLAAEPTTASLGGFTA